MTASNAKPFGALLRRHRIAAGFSQETLAEKARISAVTVGSLERGNRRAPFRATVSLLAEALRLTEEQHLELEMAASSARNRVQRRSDTSETAHNLPEFLTSFVERQTDAASVLTLFERHRFVTLCGPGGVGKTRLAIELAKSIVESRSCEAWFVDLAPLRDDNSVVERIASTVSMPFSGQGSDVKRLCAAIYSRPMLLILDNCEHVARGVASVVRELLLVCPAITVFATSRERLRVTGEATYRLPPLPVPPRTPINIETARAFGAIELFAQRAQSVDSTFELTANRISSVTDVCRQLDGLPLAIELAVARLPSLGLATLRERLQERFVLAGGNVDSPERQQTMLGTVSWSFNLLDDVERKLLRRLAIFSGGSTLPATEAICLGDDFEGKGVVDVLSSLVDKSLVNIAQTNDVARYSLLNSVRHFCLGSLSEAGELPEIARRHAIWLANEADAAEHRFAKGDQRALLYESSLEFDNMQSALARLVESEQPGDIALAGRILGGFRAVWLMRGQLLECQRWADLILERLDEARYPHVAAKVMRALHKSAAGVATMTITERAMAVYERVDRPELASLHSHLVAALTLRHRIADARRSALIALDLFTEQGTLGSRAFASFLLNRAILRAGCEEFDEARTDIAHARSIAERLYDSRFAHWCDTRLAAVEYCAGNAGLALTLVKTVLEAIPEHLADDAIAIHCHSSIATYYLATNQPEFAREAATIILTNGAHYIPSVMAIQHIAAATTVCESESDGSMNEGARAAARLIGFVDAWCTEQDYWRTPTELGTYEIAMEYLGRRFTREAITRLKNEGSAFALETAIEVALSI